MRHPGDGVGLTRAGGVQDQVVVAGAVRGRVGDKLPHCIPLMETREDQRLRVRVPRLVPAPGPS